MSKLACLNCGRIDAVLSAVLNAELEQELEALKEALCILDKEGPVQTEGC